MTEIAREYLLKAGHLFSRLEQARPDEIQHQWHLTFTVGISAQEKKTVTIDDNTGRVISFE